MAATNRRFQLQPGTDDTSFAGNNPIQPGLSDLMLGLLAQQRGVAGAGGIPGYSYATPGGHVDVAPRKAGEKLPTDSTAPNQYEELATLMDKLGGGGRGFDPVAAQTAIRNTPVADYQAQQQVAAQQSAAAGLAATAAEDTAANRATAQNVVSAQFGGPPPLGETFSKLLPQNQGTLTAFPSGGYAVAGTADQRIAKEDENRRKYAASHFFPQQSTRSKLTYNSGGNYSSY